MKAGELAAILAHIDPETEVHVIASGGCNHVTRINYKRRRPNTYGVSAGRYPNGAQLPRALVIEGQHRWDLDTLWFHEPPPFELEGSWPRRAELDATLAAIEAP